MFDDDLEEEMPLGLTMSLAEDLDAMKFFVNLSSGEQRQLIRYIQASTTGEMAKRRIEEVVDMCHCKEDFFS